jgi:NADPH:quinone reductase-like Zn-dependent oxidoreductase
VTSPARTMRAMRAASPDPASMTCQSLPVPEPAPGELLVEVRATAVTAGELTWPETWPATPCHDMSGVVATAGRGVTGWRAGEKVHGLVGFDRPGAAAEYVTVPAADLAPGPAAVDHVEAAALPLGALTAWQACRRARACISSSGPTAASCGNWPPWSTSSSYARLSPSSSSWANCQQPSAHSSTAPAPPARWSSASTARRPDEESLTR